jgi:CheY-like chemotaxis protein
VISVTPEADLTPKPVKVLVAEDEVLVRLMVAEVLRGGGFHVFEASNGQEGISILKTMPVDVVITDLRMVSRADGLELARYVRTHCPGISLVLAAAQAPPITEDLTFDAFFIKPYPPEDIANWIRRRHTSTSDHADSRLR